MIPLSRLFAAIEVVDREYWLGHCEGFEVRCAGRRLGVVELVRYGPDPSLPHTIHACAGTIRIRRVAVPVAAVEAVDPRGRTIWVRRHPSPRARRRRRVTAWLRRASETVPAVERATVRGAR